MKANKRRETTNEREFFTTHDEWEKFGLTNHTGGLLATRRLIELCGITPSQYVLDLGCGTGYTACLLAKKYQVDVIAADITPTVLEEAKKRIARERVNNKVKVIEADAHALPSHQIPLTPYLPNQCLFSVKRPRYPLKYIGF